MNDNNLTRRSSQEPPHLAFPVVWVFYCHSLRLRLATAALAELISWAAMP